MQFVIGVTELAAFVHRRGDIDDRREDLTTAREGINTQRRYQARLKQHDPTYTTEVRVAREHKLGDLVLQVTGRVDGICSKDELDGMALLVEEIKTTRKEPSTLPICDQSVHEAQLRLYAAMVEDLDHAASIATRLTYIHPDTDHTQHIESAENVMALHAFFHETAHAYLKWLTQVVKRVSRRNKQAAQQPFPFQTYNEDQLQLARLGFVSLRDKTNLLMEAPTGTGKTMATSFPAVKAMGAHEIDRAIYITAQTTGQRTAHATFARLREQNDALIQMTVSAKDRVCLTPGAPCQPEACEYAKGHYDRVRGAAVSVLEKGDIDRAVIDTVAKSHRVCPFELSLDVAEWSDIVICDYNYVFDPLIQLKRLRSRVFNRVGLLIDEAHRLTERVRDMLSCSFDLDRLGQAVQEASGSLLERPMHAVQAAFESLFDRALPTLGDLALEEMEPAATKAIDRLFETDAVLIQAPKSADMLQECLYEFLRYRTIDGIRTESPQKFVWLLKRTRDERQIWLRCLAPDSWIKSAITGFHGSIRFSGTLSPGELFNEEHGLQGPIKRVKLSQNAHRLGVYIVPGISTYFNERERTAPDLARVIERIRDVSMGNWLVAFPSFAYMELVTNHIENVDPALVQTSGMNLAERETFVNRLLSSKNQLGFVVMGGVFTESIDIEQTTLEGVVIVSPGLPPRSLERECIAALSTQGYEIAYRRPAMTRVVQAAGRVVRGEKDRGVVILIDPRFTRSEFARYFPSHWQPRIVKANDVILQLRRFQQGT